MIYHTLREWQALCIRFVGIDMPGNVIEAENKHDIYQEVQI